MRDDPGLDQGKLGACLMANYGIRAETITFLPVGYDPNASVYRVTSDDGTACFLKVRSGPVYRPALMVPRALNELGIQNISGPIPTRTATLWCRLDGHPDQTVVLYPFIEGQDASVVRLSDQQWREFGVTLRSVHDSAVDTTVFGQLPTETFGLVSAGLVRRMLTLAATTRFDRGAKARLAAFLTDRAEDVRHMLSRAEQLGRRLQAKPFRRVLCHADIHAANILVEPDGQIWLVDWDEPLLAPRERDLLFIIGSRIARRVELWEETFFFEGYGPIDVDVEALAYFRYERVVDDIGEFAKSVFLDDGLSEEAREDAMNLVAGFFEPDGMIAGAEIVARRQWESTAHVTPKPCIDS